ncbi:MAG: O-antigen ligase family protein [Hyphomicrobiaceae bacterium]
MAMTEHVVPRMGGVAVRAAARGITEPRWMVPLYFVLLALPPEIMFDVFGGALSPARVLELVMLPVAVMKLAGDPTFRWRSFDFLAVFYALWLWLAFTINYEPSKSVALGGSLTAEALGSYFIARAYVRTMEDFKRVVVAYFTTVVVVGAIAVLECLSGFYFAHEIASKIMGVPLPEYVEVSYGPATRRLGFIRPFSTFDHPILYGSFCAAAAGLVYYAYKGDASRTMRLLIIAGAVFFSLSSGPYLGLLLAIAFCGWEIVTRPLPHRVLISAGVVLALLGVISLVSSRSIIEILIASTLEPASGYYRLFIWQYGSAAVMSSPIFGIAINTWQKASFMSTSVDNFWLLMTMQGGIPAIAALLLSQAMLIRGAHKGGRGPVSPQVWAARFGWTSTLLVLSAQALTVHYWGQMYMFLFFVMGMGGWLSDRLPQAAPAAPTEEAGTQRWFTHRTVQARPRLSERRAGTLSGAGTP